MKKYAFEYTKQGFAYLLFGISFAIVFLGILLFRTFLTNLISAGLAIIILLTIAVIFFLLNKYRIKRIGTASLSAHDLTMELDQFHHVVFSDIKYYYIYGGKNGIVFTLGLTDGTKLKIGANNNFCDTELLKTFLTEFQLAIENYKAENKVDIVHLESVLARKRTIYILTTITVLVILGFRFTRMPIMILPIGVSASLLVSWIKYFQLKSRDKLVDF